MQYIIKLEKLGTGHRQQRLLNPEPNFSASLNQISLMPPEAPVRHTGRLNGRSCMNGGLKCVFSPQSC